MAAQSVVITGSTQGLGFGYAREFVRRGHQVVVSGRGEARVKAAVERLGSEFPDARQCISGFACEISELEQVRALWDHGSFNAAQTAVAGMARQGGGKLYLTLGGGGASGRVVPGMTVYSTTKRAVKYLANCLVKERRELHDESILIGTISPGINITEGMLREMRTIPQAQRARALKQLNFIGEHVETTTPWIVERVLNDRKQGNDITWLTGGRLAGRALAMMFGARRDVVSRYSFEA